MIAHHGEARLTVAIRFNLPDPGELQQFLHRAGRGLGDGLERGIGEDDEGRLAGLIRRGLAPFLQRREKLLVVGHLAVDVPTEFAFGGRLQQRPAHFARTRLQ